MLLRNREYLFPSIQKSSILFQTFTILKILRYYLTEEALNVVVHDEFTQGFKQIDVISHDGQDQEIEEIDIPTHGG